MLLLFLRNTDIPPLLGNITKLHLLMLQGECFENILVKVIVFVHDTSSERALQMFDSK